MSQATSQSTSGSLAGRAALVTGAATGIGKAIAGALAAAGARVVVNYPHPPELAAAVVADIEEEFDRSFAVNVKGVFHVTAGKAADAPPDPSAPFWGIQTE